ncbi:MAG: methylmalonyl Co-A mutase-associated GTPase MeaB [Rhodobacteraceae bacterium]|nr:methylmalonyl Co-A mutase-associated GTPase MeaB [Paracoccaceae bacterium]
MSAHTNGPAFDLDDLARDLKAGQRAALARAITLIESRKPEHRARAHKLLQLVLADTGKSLRIGISGVPGVGKSTLIDMLGSYLTGRGHKVAVLAVDPSSVRTGGSILGDKTRMAQLSIDRNAFIRPSPAAGTLGGVAAKTRESLLLCEAAGFDIILVETVGVGQSETSVANMVDFFMVLMLPGAGDELQGIKKGILEVADMLVVNKADGDNRELALSTASSYRRALELLMPNTPGWTPPVQTMSALKLEDMAPLWQNALDHHETCRSNGAFEARRNAQRVDWFKDQLMQRLIDQLYQDREKAALMKTLEAEVQQGSIEVTTALERLFGPMPLND